MEKESSHKPSRGRLLWALVLILAWTGVLVLFLKTHGDLSLAELLRYRPQRPLTAALVMLLLFALKGVDFILHSGILYAASGVMFSLPAALLLNVLGMLLMSSIPYFVGRSLGQPVLHYVAERFPRFRVVANIRSQSQLIIAVLIRLAGLPLAIAGLYMGAAEFRFGRYTVGSLLGLLPSALCFTVMGMNVSDLSSPAFWIALGCHVLIFLLSIGLYALLRRRGK